MSEPSQTPAEWYQNGGAKPWAALAMLAALVVAVVGGISGSLPAVLGAILFGVLAYASIWRPAVGMDDEALMLRGMYSTLFLPLHQVDEIGVHRTFAAMVGERRYVSSALSRSLRQSLRGPRTRTRPEDAHYHDMVETQLRARMEHSRFLGETGAPIRREWAPIEIAVTIVVAVAFVISFFV